MKLCKIEPVGDDTPTPGLCLYEAPMSNILCLKSAVGRLFDLSLLVQYRVLETLGTREPSAQSVYCFVHFACMIKSKILTMEEWESHK